MDKPFSIKQYYLSVINGQRKGALSSSLKSAFFLISLLYKSSLSARLFCYNAGFIKKTKLPAPVICVGNITMGGSGKTPLVQYIAGHLKSRGKKAAILSRGYGAKKPGFNAGESKNSEKDNDESLMLKENLSDTPNILNSDRVIGGKIAINEHKAECLIMDDGFQHMRLERTLDIVVINSLNPFGYGYVAPRGFLREPLNNLQRAGAFVIAHCNLCDESRLRTIRERLARLNGTAPIFETEHALVKLEDISNSAALPMDWLQNKKVYAFCAIGEPESFGLGLKGLKADLLELETFVDHHFFSRDELLAVIKKAKELGADAIIATQKDKVKIIQVLTPYELKSCETPFIILKVAMKLVKDEERFKELIDNATR